MSHENTLVACFVLIISLGACAGISALIEPKQANAQVQCGVRPTEAVTTIEDDELDPTAIPPLEDEVDEGIKCVYEDMDRENGEYAYIGIYQYKGQKLICRMKFYRNQQGNGGIFTLHLKQAPPGQIVGDLSNVEAQLFKRNIKIDAFKFKRSDCMSYSKYYTRKFLKRAITYYY